MEFIKNKKEIILAFAAIIFISIPTLIAQFEYALDPSLLHEEQSILFVDHKVKDPTLFPDGYLSKYQENFTAPLLYDFIYKSMIKYFDVYAFHKIFPMVIWVLMILFMGIAAYKIGGIYAMWGAVVITISHNMFLYQITSSIPHSFAYLLIIMSIVCILYAKVYFLAIVGVLSAFLYPAVSPVIGFSMAYFLLIMNKNERGEAKEWSIYKRLILLAVTAAIMLAAIYPVMAHIDGYGRYVKPYTETEEFPENSKDGGYFLGIQHPFAYVISKLYVQFDVSNEFKTLLAMASILAIVIISMREWYFFKDDKVVKSRFNSFIASSILTLILVYLFMPFYTYRLLIYTLPVFYVLVFPVALLKMIKKDKKLDKKHHKIISIAIIIALIFLLEGKDSLRIGYMLKISEKEESLFKYISEQPKDSLITGWPASSGYNDWIPYKSKRNVLAMRKLHQFMYYDYNIEIRKRIYAIINAFLGDDIESIRYLKSEFGVDFIVVDTNMYEEMPFYMYPFDKKIEELWIKNKELNQFEILKHLDKADYHKDNLYVIDISKL